MEQNLLIQSCASCTTPQKEDICLGPVGRKMFQGPCFLAPNVVEEK